MAKGGWLAFLLLVVLAGLGYLVLGTDPEHKFHYRPPGSHFVPQNELITQTLNWLDKYLGVPGGS